MRPETMYARTSDDVWIAYQVFGDGARDLVLVNAWVSHLEIMWEQPRFRSMVEALTHEARVITFDKRGTGLSDRISQVPDLEARMDDIRAVMDAAGSKRATLFGWGDGGALASLFAATYPERTAGLVLFDGSARMTWAPDYPWGLTEEAWQREHARIPAIWGTREYAREWAEMSWLIDPGAPDDPDLFDWAARWARYSAAPGDMLMFDRMWAQTDVRNILPAIQVPTSVLYGEGSDPSQAKHVAAMISGAQLVGVKGGRGLVWAGDIDELRDAVGSFLASIRNEESAFDRVFATVLFTDIVDSTAQSAALGDEAWGKLQDAHDAVVRAQLARFNGREIRKMGDGFLATFDGPGRAVRCALAIAEGVKTLGIEIRAGLHAGEIELVDGDIAGIAVAIGARVGALATGSEVLVSSTVRDLVTGSSLELEDRGTHTLKGVPGEWRLYAVAANVRVGS
jgi:class 3 adenylate cyclase